MMFKHLSPVPKEANGSQSTRATSGRRSGQGMSVTGESVNKSQRLGNQLSQQLSQFKKLQDVIHMLPSHAARQNAYHQLLCAMDASEKAAVEMMKHDDDVALENGRRRIAQLREEIGDNLAEGYCEPSNITGE